MMARVMAACYRRNESFARAKQVLAAGAQECSLRPGDDAMIQARHARMLTALAFAATLAGCASILARAPSLKGGELSGKLALAWEDGYNFVAYPVAGDPLTYKLPAGHRLASLLGEIKPELMFTDGGSIPRTFWSFRGLSPWEYGPAFILHDWIFSRHYCGKDTYPVTLDEANDILLDAMILLDKQVMKKHGKRPHNDGEVRQLIDAAVTGFSAEAWNKGKCPKTPPDLYKVVVKLEKRQETRLLANGRSVVVERVVPVERRVKRYRQLFVLPTD
jgi:Protein of unknown function (DUF1353)